MIILLHLNIITEARCEVIFCLLTDKMLLIFDHWSMWRNYRTSLTLYIVLSFDMIWLRNYLAFARWGGLVLFIIIDHFFLTGSICKILLWCVVWWHGLNMVEFWAIHWLSLSLIYQSISSSLSYAFVAWHWSALDYVRRVDHTLSLLISFLLVVQLTRILLNHLSFAHRLIQRGSLCSEWATFGALNPRKRRFFGLSSCTNPAKQELEAEILIIAPFPRCELALCHRPSS